MLEFCNDGPEDDDDWVEELDFYDLIDDEYVRLKTSGFPLVFNLTIHHNDKYLNLEFIKERLQ